MAATVVFPGRGKALYTVLKGALHGKKCRWFVTVWYDVANLEADERNPRSIKLNVNRPVWLRDITPLVDAHLRDEDATCGGVSNIRWQAVQER